FSYQISAKPAPRTRNLYAPAGRLPIDHVPSSPVAVLRIGDVRAEAANSSTETPAIGRPLVESNTLPPSADEPASASEFLAAATWIARSRSAADCPTSADSAMVMTVANTVAANSRLSSDSNPRLSLAFCSRVPVASGSGGGAAG